MFYPTFGSISENIPNVNTLSETFLRNFYEGNMETIYERVERLRAENDIKSKLALEMDAGISNGAINKMRFHTPSLKTVEKLSKRLGVSVNYIYTGTDAPAIEKESPAENEDSEKDIYVSQINDCLARMNERNRKMLLELAQVLAQDQQVP